MFQNHITPDNMKEKLPKGKRKNHQCSEQEPFVSMEKTKLITPSDKFNPKYIGYKDALYFSVVLENKYIPGTNYHQVQILLHRNCIFLHPYIISSCLRKKSKQTYRKPITSAEKNIYLTMIEVEIF